MNKNWKTFLISQQAQFSDDGEIYFPSAANSDNNAIYPIANLSVISVTGTDAATFLQGQVTCNIKEISEKKGSFGAFCSAKGRAITTFFVIKHHQTYLLILPTELVEKVIKKLRLYILRADVRLENSEDTLCLMGVNDSDPKIAALVLPEEHDSAVCVDDLLFINLPSSQSRYLVVSSPSAAIEFWQKAIANKGCHPENSVSWTHLDILAGIPWLNAESSEAFTPQMINLDQLGGISFNKGCYTGQEVVARTHYLGKAKRQMYLAECKPTEPLAANLNIIEILEAHSITVGNVLMFSCGKTQTMMLVVLQISHAASKNLHLENVQQDEVYITGLPYKI